MTPNKGGPTIKPFGWLPNQEGFRFMAITTIGDFECVVSRDKKTGLHYVENMEGQRVIPLCWYELNNQASETEKRT